MRSKEFIAEAPARFDDSGNELGPARGSVAAAQADAARIEQGQKNLNALKGFFGAKPEELKDAPPGTSIDPVQRARMGYKPATQQEIAAFQAANPNYGKVVDRNGNPIKSGTPGVTWDAGGEKGVVQTAQAAASQSKGDVHAGQQGYNTDLERIPGAAQRDQGGYNYQEPNIMPAPRVRADRTADIQADADAEAARAAAAADRDRKAIGSTESPVQSVTPPPKAAEREWDPRVYGAAHAGQGGTAPEIIRPNAMAAPGEPPVADVDVYKRSEMDDFGREGNRKRAEPVQQNPTPTKKPVSTVTTDPNQRIKRQSGGARKPWGTVKDKDGLQVYIDNDGGKWVWPANGSSWKPANMVPGADYVDKKLPTTIGYTPPGQSATPTPTSGNPVYDRFKTVDAVDAEIKRLKDKGADMRLPANQQYISNLEARKAELGGTGPAAPAQAATPVAASGAKIDPKVKMLQQNLNDAGANLKVDGIMGPATQAAMKKYPNALRGYPWMTGAILEEPSMKESSDIQRMRFLAGLTKD